eukprot:31291-Pelagococcus_subviridis.AAC.1
MLRSREVHGGSFPAATVAPVWTFRRRRPRRGRRTVGTRSVVVERVRGLVHAAAEAEKSRQRASPPRRDPGLTRRAASLHVVRVVVVGVVPHGLLRRLRRVRLARRRVLGRLLGHPHPRARLRLLSRALLPADVSLASLDRRRRPRHLFREAHVPEQRLVQRRGEVHHDGQRPGEDRAPRHLVPGRGVPRARRRAAAGDRWLVQKHQRDVRVLPVRLRGDGQHARPRRARVRGRAPLVPPRRVAAQGLHADVAPQQREEEHRDDDVVRPRELDDALARGGDGLLANLPLPVHAHARDDRLRDDRDHLERGLRAQRHDLVRGRVGAEHRARERGEGDEKAARDERQVVNAKEKNRRVTREVDPRPRVVVCHGNQRGEADVHGREESDRREHRDRDDAGEDEQPRQALVPTRAAAVSHREPRVIFHLDLVVLALLNDSLYRRVVDVVVQALQRLRVRAVLPHLFRDRVPGFADALLAVFDRLAFAVFSRLAFSAGNLRKDAAVLDDVRVLPNLLPRPPREIPGNARERGPAERHERRAGEKRQRRVRFLPRHVRSQKDRGRERVHERAHAAAVARERRARVADEHRDERGELEDQVRSQNHAHPPAGDVEEPHPNLHERGSALEKHARRRARHRVREIREVIAEKRLQRAVSITHGRVLHREHHHLALALVRGLAVAEAARARGHALIRLPRRHRAKQNFLIRVASRSPSLPPLDRVRLRLRAQTRPVHDRLRVRDEPLLLRLPRRRRSARVERDLPRVRPSQRRQPRRGDDEQHEERDAQRRGERRHVRLRVRHARLVPDHGHLEVRRHRARAAVVHLDLAAVLALAVGAQRRDEKLLIERRVRVLGIGMRVELGRSRRHRERPLRRERVALRVSRRRRVELDLLEAPRDVRHRRE